MSQPSRVCTPLAGRRARRRHALLAGLLVAGTFAPTPAQAEGATAPAIWTMGVADVSLHRGQDTGAVLHLDVHARRERTRFVGLVRPGLAWDLSGALSLWAGYTYVPVVSNAGTDVAGHDVWQQLLWRSKVGPFSLQARLRFEERWHSEHDGLAVRGRLFVRASTPIDGDIALVINDEVLVNLNDPSWAPRGLGEERLFLGLGIGPGGRRFELGYLLIVRPQAATTVQHTVMMAYFFGQ